MSENRWYTNNCKERTDEHQGSFPLFYSLKQFFSNCVPWNFRILPEPDGSRKDWEEKEITQMQPVFNYLNFASWSTVLGNSFIYLQVPWLGGKMEISAFPGPSSDQPINAIGNLLDRFTIHVLKVWIQVEVRLIDHELVWDIIPSPKSLFVLYLYSAEDLPACRHGFNFHKA